MVHNDSGKVLKYLLIVLGAVAVILTILIAIGAWYSTGMKENAQAFFDQLRTGNYAGAYALTSKEFRKATTLEDLEVRMEGPELEGVEWESERSAGRDKKKLDATLLIKGGIKGPISVTMIKEEDGWKILAVDPRKPKPTSEAKETAKKKTEELPGYAWSVRWTTARITQAFMAKDYRTQPIVKTDVFSPNAERIYCLLMVSYAPPTTDVTAQWIFVGGPESEMKDYEIGRDSRTTEKGADLMFSMGRPDRGFPKGEYLVKLFVDGKLQQTVPFKVSE